MGRYKTFTTGCVFNGSDLGKQYSAKAIQERCGINIFAEQGLVQQIHGKLQPFSAQPTGQTNEQSTLAPTLNNTDKAGLLEISLQAEHTSGFIP